MATHTSEPDRSGLPNLIVIGAQKCGTSSLHHYLGLHPEVTMSTPKELNFFIDRQNWSRGLDWYRGHFDPAAKVRGESSPNYTNHPTVQGVAERMAEVVPGARLIYLVRDPIERIAAQWVHQRASLYEKLDMPDALAAPRATYVDRSSYFRQLQRFLEHFPRDHVLVLDSDDLRNHRPATLREVFEFIGVDPGFDHPQFARERHSTSRKRRPTSLGVLANRLRPTNGRGLRGRAFRAVYRLPLLSKTVAKPLGVREMLGPAAVELLHEDAERLRELTGRRFAGWSV